MTPAGITRHLDFWFSSAAGATSVPAYWYIIVAVVVATPAYFLLSRPRKKKNDSRWKG